MNEASPKPQNMFVTAETMLFSEYTARTAKNIAGLIFDYAEALDPNAELTPALQYSLKGGGKYIRPVLAQMTAEDFGIETAEIKPLLTAIELMHTSSLIKDDLPAQDNATMRRAKPALHIKFPEVKAQNTADHLLVSSFLEITKLSPLWGHEKTLKLSRYFMHKVQELLEGQTRDTSHRPGTDTKYAEETATLKTGSGFQMSVVPFAMLLGSNSTVLESASAFARHFGIAFQVKDDIGGFTKSTEELGKDSGLDEKNRRTTFIQTCGSVGKALSLMHVHADLAKDHSSNLPGNESRRKNLINSLIFG